MISRVTLAILNLTLNRNKQPRITALVYFSLSYGAYYIVLIMRYWSLGLLHGGLAPTFSIFLAYLLSTGRIISPLSATLFSMTLYTIQLTLYLDRTYYLRLIDISTTGIGTIASMLLYPLIVNALAISFALVFWRALPLVHKLFMHENLVSDPQSLTKKLSSR